MLEDELMLQMLNNSAAFLQKINLGINCFNLNLILWKQRVKVSIYDPKTEA